MEIRMSMDPKMTSQLTNNLTAAVAAWFSMAAKQLDTERWNLMDTCLASPDADLFVVIRFREGALTLEASHEKAGKRFELFREDIEPLRPTDYFGYQSEGGRY
jgi:hypothetical protein